MPFNSSSCFWKNFLFSWFYSGSETFCLAFRSEAGSACCSCAPAFAGCSEADSAFSSYSNLVDFYSRRPGYAFELIFGCNSGQFYYLVVLEEYHFAIYSRLSSANISGQRSWSWWKSQMRHSWVWPKEYWGLRTRLGWPAASNYWSTHCTSVDFPTSDQAHFVELHFTTHSNH